MVRRTPSTLRELRRSTLFHGLTRRELVAVDRLLTVVEVPAGTVLTTEGRPATEFFVVLAGQVDLRTNDRLVTTCGAGAHFGHIAMTRQDPSTATFVTTTPTRLAVFGRQELRALRGVSLLLSERLAVAGAVEPGVVDAGMREPAESDVVERIAA